MRHGSPGSSSYLGAILARDRFKRLGWCRAAKNPPLATMFPKARRWFGKERERDAQQLLRDSRIAAACQDCFVQPIASRFLPIVHLALRRDHARTSKRMQRGCRRTSKFKWNHRNHLKVRAMGLLKSIFKPVEAGRPEAQRESKVVSPTQSATKADRQPRYHTKVDESGCKLRIATWTRPTHHNSWRDSNHGGPWPIRYTGDTLPLRARG